METSLLELDYHIRGKYVKSSIAKNWVCPIIKIFFIFIQFFSRYPTLAFRENFDVGYSLRNENLDISFGWECIITKYWNKLPVVPVCKIHNVPRSICLLRKYCFPFSIPFFLILRQKSDTGYCKQRRKFKRWYKERWDNEKRSK